MPQTPTDPTKAQVWVTGTAPNQQLEFYIPRGAKGEPGGYTAGTPLLSNNLNDIKVPGIYKQDNGSLVTLLLNYPVVASGIMHVDERVAGGSGSVMQTFYPFSGASGINPRSFYKRYMVSGSTWGPWEAYVSQRVDQTAGRAIYTWDTLNQREQLIYGDTGWRSVPVDNIGTVFASGSILMRRIGSVVHFKGGGLTTGSSPVSATQVILSSWPAGFVPGIDLAIFEGRNMNDGTIGKFRVTNTHLMNYTTQAANGLLNFYHSVITNDAWPTTLPGTAAGTIPNL